MAAFPRRYGIYFADLNPTVGGELQKVRPVVVASQNERNRFLDTVVVCPLTSTLHPRSGGAGSKCPVRARLRKSPWTGSA